MCTAGADGSVTVNVDTENPEILNNFIRNILAIPDVELQARALAGHLERLDAEAAVTVLHGLQTRGGARHPERPWRAAVHALLTPGLIHYDRLQSWYRIAAAMGLVAVRYSLIDAPARRVHRPPPDPVPGLTLGERRWKARLRDPLILEKLRRDPDPAVIQHLLANPRTLELEVVLLASQRPAFASALVEIARHPRWVAVPEVQASLAHNPYTPTRVSVLVLPLLSAGALRRVAFDGVVHTIVREVAGELLAPRAPGPDPTA